jgi:hypothetical protein
MVLCTCNLSTPESEAGELKVPGQPGQHIARLNLKKKGSEGGIEERREEKRVLEKKKERKKMEGREGGKKEEKKERKENYMSVSFGLCLPVHVCMCVYVCVLKGLELFFLHISTNIFEIQNEH